jgi:uncharacterized protein (DUF1810 family)
MKIETPGWNLDRFLQAQAGTYEGALGELLGGRKWGHWMWFVFPQLAGLGRSATARRYALSGLGEARAYLAHPVLGSRLCECMQAVMDSSDSVAAVFPYPDDLKFHSCATLFFKASNGGAPFAEVLQRLLGGRTDPETMRLLEEEKTIDLNEHSVRLADARLFPAESGALFQINLKTTCDPLLTGFQGRQEADVTSCRD